MESKILQSFYGQLKNELDNILDFWITNSVDIENGGFYGYITNDLAVDKTYQKASVLYSRILWTFSTAYRIYKDNKYFLMADRAYRYILDNFIDRKFSGVYWMVGHEGRVVNPKKQIYAVAFAVYGFSEYYRATGNKESLNYARELFYALEEYAYDKKYKGYIEALSEDWSPLSDMSLSEKDMNVHKSMNTHLHVLEAYTNLLRVWDNDLLKTRLKELIEVTMEYIIDKDNDCFKLFFNEEWKPLSHAVSFGHDIEGSWLLYEAAEVLGDKELLGKTKNVSLRMAEKVFEKGFDMKNGGLFNEEEEGVLKDTKDWWPQAEAVVGFYNAYQLSKERYFLDASLKVWDFIEKFIVDKVNGEWFWGVSADGSMITGNEKVGPWKCPYHNSRMCLEMLHRLENMAYSAL